VCAPKTWQLEISMVMPTSFWQLAMQTLIPTMAQIVLENLIQLAKSPKIRWSGQ
jgi:hypothetical protein